MTEIRYIVTDAEGNETVVTNMPEAKRLVEEKGGTYKQVFDSVISQGEAFGRAGARLGGKQRGV